MPAHQFHGLRVADHRRIVGEDTPIDEDVLRSVVGEQLFRWEHGWSRRRRPPDVPHQMVVIFRTEQYRSSTGDVVGSHDHRFDGIGQSSVSELLQQRLFQWSR